MIIVNLIITLNDSCSFFVSFVLPFVICFRHSKFALGKKQKCWDLEIFDYLPYKKKSFPTFYLIFIFILFSFLLYFQRFLNDWIKSNLDNRLATSGICCVIISYFINWYIGKPIYTILFSYLSKYIYIYIYIILVKK